MFKKLLVVLSFIAIQKIINAQANEIILGKINTYKELNSFLKKHTQYNGGTISLNSLTDSSNLSKQLYKLDSGEIITIKDTTYKLMSKANNFFNKFSYIYLDGKSYTKKQADSLRKDIIELYKKGFAFSMLASMYNMDGNKTGELNWTAKGLMVKTVEDALDEHNVNDVFCVDTPDLNWYHVILKESNALKGEEIVLFWIMKK